MTTRDTIYDSSGFIGLLVPDEGIVPANLRANDGTANNSSYTEGGRRPGVPVYDQDEVAITSTTSGDLGPSMALETTGEQADVDYHVKVLRGGIPGDGCTVVYRAALTSAAPWMGGQTHNVITYVHTGDQIESSMAAGTTGYDTTRGYACCTAADGTVVMALGREGGDIRIRRYDPATRTVAGGVIEAATPGEAPTDLDEDTAFYSTELNGSDELQAVELLTLPSGRILMAALVIELGYTGAAGAARQLMMSYSDDDGVTWRTGSYLMLDESPSAADSHRKIRMCLGRGGTVLLLIEYTWDTNLWGAIQYASADNGHTFTLIEDWQDSAPRGRHFDCVFDGTTGMITVWYHNETDTQIEYRRIASPFSPLLLASATVHNQRAPTNITCYADPDGSLYATWNHVTALGMLLEMARSTDGGATWTTFTRNVLELALGQEGENEFDWDVTSAKGVSVWMICDPTSDIAGASSRSFFLMMHTGGWDTLTHPQVKSVDHRQLEAWGSGEAWVPWRLPSAYDWTKTGAGTSVLRTAAPFGVTLTTAAQQAYYSNAGTNDAANGVTVWFRVKSVSGGDVATQAIAVEVQIEDGGTDEWDVTCNFDGAQVRMIDVPSGATIATVAVDTATAEVEFKLAVRRWPNSSSATTAAATLYQASAVGSNVWSAVIVSPAGLTRRIVATSASFIRWGAIANSTAVSEWGPVLSMRYTGNVGRIVTGTADYGFFDDLALNIIQSSPWSLFGAPLPALPARRYIASGLNIHGSGGPGTRGDTWKIEPDADYPIRHIHPDVAASPEIPARSTVDNALWRVAWSPQPYPHQMGYPSTGVAMFGCNIRYADLLGFTGGAWVTLGRVDFTGGMTGLAFTLAGSTVRVSLTTTVSGAQWIAYNELAGATVKLDSGTGTVKYRRIAVNTEGSFTDRDTKRPILTLQGLDGTEPTSGTLEIWYREAALLLHNQITAYGRFAIEVPAHVTADGYYELGTVVMGGLSVFGHKYSRNRTIGTAPNFELTTAMDGTRTGRKLGASRKVIEASWVEGVDTTALWSSTPAPPYLAARASGLPFAARGDATLLEGIVDRLGGGARVCCYFPRIPVTASSGDTQDKTYLAGPERVKLVRLVDTVTRQTTLGNEAQNEVVTVTGFRGETEV